MSCAQEVSIPVPSLQEKKADVVPGEERKEAVDAAIVRILKARKRMQHADLIQEVLLQIKFFRPDPRLIKNRIDTLMNTYMRREDPMSITSPYMCEHPYSQVPLLHCIACMFCAVMSLEKTCKRSFPTKTTPIQYSSCKIEASFIL